MKRVLLPFLLLFYGCNFSFAVDVSTYGELYSALQNGETNIILINDIYTSVTIINNVSANVVIDGNYHAFEGGGLSGF